MDEPYSLVVAEARLAKTVRVGAEAPPAIRLGSGQAVMVKFAYRLAEMSAQEEQWRLRLSAQVDDGEVHEVLRTHEDTPGLSDDVWSHLKTLVEPPDDAKSITYSVEAAVFQRPWGDQERHGLVDRKILEGSVALDHD